MEMMFFYTGDVLSFTASSPLKNIDWNFGDNTADAGEVVHHQFLTEGTYLVKLSGDFLCPFEKEITIQKPPVIAPTINPYRDKIEGPTSFYTNKEQKFTYQLRVSSYKWSVQNHADFGTKSGQSVSFTFNDKGTYTIQVELDGDPKKQDALDVTVLEDKKTTAVAGGGGDDGVVKLPPPPLPPPPDSSHNEIPPKEQTPKPKGPIYLANDLFLIYLEKVQTGQMKLEQFAPYGIFDTTPVTANDKPGQTFAWLCSEINKTKKKGFVPMFKKDLHVKLKSASVQRINGIVSVIEVKYDYKK